MRSIRVGFVLGALGLLTACGDHHAAALSPGGGSAGSGGAGSGSAASGSAGRGSAGRGSAGSGAQPRVDAGAGEAGTGNDPGGLPEAGSGDEGESVTDRCFGPNCAPTRLPPQPDLEFLEDMGDGWQRLMEADWELAAGSEGYRCMTLTIPQDIYIVAFAPQNPFGTHHATFGVSTTPAGPDEVVACGVGAGGERKLQGSGAGTESSELPPGVAMPLHSGEQVLMNLHLFNVTDAPISGRSGMWVKTVPREQVEHEAEAVLAGPLSLDIPVGRSTQTGGCTLRADATIYAAGPHMHQKGVHLRATVATADGERTIFDDDYDFSHQLFHDTEDVQVRAGDRVNVECTYENDTDGPLHWGDSSLDEMCFISLQLYPAIGYGALPCGS